MTETESRLDEINRFSEWAVGKFTHEIREEIAQYVVKRIKEVALASS